MQELLREINLWNCKDRHDKVYNIYLYKTPLENKWTVDVTYGRRGSHLTKLTKHKDVSYHEANHHVSKLINEKVAKHYAPITNSWVEPESIKKPFFKTYLVELLSKGILKSEEYQRVNSLMNNDDESFNLAVGIITAKELQYGY